MNHHLTCVMTEIHANSICQGQSLLHLWVHALSLPTYKLLKNARLQMEKTVNKLRALLLLMVGIKNWSGMTQPQVAAWCIGR